MLTWKRYTCTSMQQHPGLMDQPHHPFNTVLRISCASITSNMIGCGSGGGESSSTKDDGLGGCLSGFFNRTSQTVSIVSLSGSTTLSRGRVPLPLLSVMIRRGAWTFPPIISLVNILAVSTCFFGGVRSSWCWIVHRVPSAFNFSKVVDDTLGGACVP